jgi:hypothetical protein
MNIDINQHSRENMESNSLKQKYKMTFNMPQTAMHRGLELYHVNRLIDWGNSRLHTQGEWGK